MSRPTWSKGQVGNKRLMRYAINTAGVDCEAIGSV